MNKLYFGKVNIIGFGESGKAVYRLLKNYNNYIKVFEHGKGKISNTKIYYDAINSEIFNSDLVIPSPGVNYGILRKFIEKEINILPEIEIGYYNIDKRRSFLIGITGTNGKTTTSLLIDHILKPFNSMLYGNIGNAFCNNRKEIGLFILELSSFQLSIVKRFKVNVGVFLNIDYDHIDWHLSFENYLSAKMNIFKNQDENDFKVINLDDENILKNLPSVPSRNLYFSIKNNSADCYFKNDRIYLFSKEILNVKDFQAFSLIHNVYNLMASILAVYCFVKNIEVLKRLLNERLGSFKIPEHRLEFVREINGIKFYNDSKATNPHAVKFALMNFNKCILIMGGLTKNADFSILRDIVKERVSFIVAFGKNRKFFYNEFKDIVSVYEFENLEDAVKFAFENSNKEPILFSPGGSSFDLFKDYKHRGKVFKEIVLKL